MEIIKINDFNNHTLSESDIIKRILSGEKELYEILLRRNNQKLYRVIRSYISNTAEIEDIMQNTYLKSYEKLYQFKHHSSYSTWLIRIGINEALARLKTKSKVLHLNTAQNLNSNSILERPDTSQLNPESKIIRKEAKQLLEKTIDSLDTKYKTVYILKEVEEMSIKDIANCLNISTANTKVRLHRAKHMLKEKLFEITTNVDIFEFGFSKCDDLTEKIMSIILKD
ncbi:RNA polymerase sigma factor [uncultured Psychroserpens sp.]|uniref:RNA polymerase sigma factor n=1 Tax=uncultured Psychroserpens sp. TaxID=255436 RepID=UPI0026380FE4|nr:RNA polymerase sigma factor [uncultured Psychroserpens sp.]